MATREALDLHTDNGTARAETSAWLKQRCASPAAIETHYDVGNAFFALWLDPELIYTCALWDGIADPTDLEGAQQQKIDYYARALGIGAGARVLDVGCGWGGALRRFRAVHGATSAIGLTLSPSQRELAQSRGYSGTEVLVQDWVDYEPDRRFDAILSIEAIEAFARQGLARAEKVRIYRALFERAHSWLSPSCLFGLQMIAYGHAGPEQFDRFIAGSVFPESDLPRLSEVIEAAEGIFEVVTLRNVRGDYVMTLKCWLARLKGQRERARALIGEPAVKRFEDYLRLSWHMFGSGACDLHRLIMRRIDRRRLVPTRASN
jgi:cyclopropane-fatty-acyl-phospholipid synthase